MKSRIFLLSLLALSILGLLSGSIQQNAEQLYQSGIYKEEVEGKLEKAIEVFEQILADFPENQAVAAKALFHIGLCYEKLGNQEARKAYQRLIDEYPGQVQEVNLTKARLASLAKAFKAVPREPTFRKILIPTKITAGDIRLSPDGKTLAFSDVDLEKNEQHIYTIPVEGGKAKRLVDALAREQEFDLIILDIMLPKMDGFEVCKQLRKEEIGTPILMLTAKSQEIDKVLGLELGADDYVTKPFSPRELLARVKALLRRTNRFRQGKQSFKFDDFEVDFGKYEAKKGRKIVYLTALELSLLHFFIQNKDRVVSRDAILDEVWGRDVYIQPRTVDKHIAELRKKIENDPSSPEHIIGIRGVGYKFTG